MHLHLPHLDLTRMASHVPFLLGSIAMIASVEAYVETLPKLRKAIGAVVILVLAGFGGGVFVATFNIDDRMTQVEGQVNLNTAYVAEDRENVSKILDRIDNLTCDLYGVDHAVCTYWLDNGRPTRLQDTEP